MENNITNAHATTHNMSRILTVLSSADFPMTKTEIRIATSLNGKNCLNDALNWLIGYGFIKKIILLNESTIRYTLSDKEKIGLNTINVIDGDFRFEIKIKPNMTKDEFIDLCLDAMDKINKNEEVQNDTNNTNN